MAEVVQPWRELAGLLASQGVVITDAIWDMVLAHARGSMVVQTEAAEVLGARLSELLGLSDLMGRRRVVLAASRLPREPGAPPFSPGPPPSVPPTPPSTQGGGGAGPFQPGRPRPIPNVKFQKAVDDITRRYPTVVPPNVRDLGPQAVQEWIGSLYGEQGFTLARTTQDVVVDRVQRVVRKALDKGMPQSQALDEIIQAAGEHGDAWTRAYAETVFRNNTSTAYHAGIQQQMKDPAVQRVIGALQFHAVGGRAGDGDTTPVCRQAHGTLAVAGDPIWDSRTPPLHHRCRSSLVFVTWAELKRMGRLDSTGNVARVVPPFKGGVGPAPGFGGRK